MKLSFMVVVALTLQGCAYSKKTYLADGREGVSIDCSGGAMNWGYCERKAGDICKARGYEIISALQDKNPVAISEATGGASGYVNGQNAQYNSGSSAFSFAGMNTSRTMLVACR